MMASSDGSLIMDVRHVPGGAVVDMRGTAGSAEAETIRTELEKLAAEPLPLIVLDLSDMSFICSMALAALIHGHLKLRKHNGHIRLVNPQPNVKHLLETTRLTNLFPVYDNLDQAMAASTE